MILATEHVPILVSICSNVEGCKMPHCLVDQNTNKLVSKMVESMTQICDKSYELAKTKFADAFEKLDLIIRSEEPEVVEEDVSGDQSENLEKIKENHRSQCQKLKEELDRYCHQLPCLSFNGSKYDLNLIKKYFGGSFKHA